MRSVNILKKITEVLPAEIVLKYPFGELGVTKLKRNEKDFIGSRYRDVLGWSFRSTFYGSEIRS